MAKRNDKKILRIRRRFEHGENLNALCSEYKISLSTVNNRKASDADRGDPWIKGSKTPLAFKAYDEGIDERKRILCKEIEDRAREDQRHLDKLVRGKKSYEARELEYGEDDYVKLSKAQEEAYILRSSFIEKYMILRKKIENIISEEELLEYESKKLGVELKKLEIESKRLDIEDRKIDIELKKKEAAIFIGG